jgi:hypothetical protein
VSERIEEGAQRGLKEPFAAAEALALAPEPREALAPPEPEAEAAP